LAFVDLKRDRLILKVVLTGPPAVGKTERLDQIGKVGRRIGYGSTALGPTQMAILPIEAEREGRPVEIEVYEWHGLEKADVRTRGMFVGIDGLIYIVDARQDRHVDSVAQFEHLVETAGKSKLRRLPAVLMLGQMDEGLLRLASFEEQLQGPTWSERLELPLEQSEPFIEALRVYGEVMLARVL
jgi:hypothetical protein